MIRSRLATRAVSLSGAVLLLAATGASSNPALAAPISDTWQRKYEGIEHLIRRGVDQNGAMQSYHVARIDLTNPKVKLRAVLNNDSWGGAKEVVSKMARRHDAVVAVNGDYWNWGINDPAQGTTAVQGTCYRAHPDRSAIAFSADLTQVEIGRYGTWPIAETPPDDCPAWIHNAIGAGPQFLFDGVDKWQAKANANDSSMVDINDDTWFGAEAWNWGTGRDPNTAAGISKDGRTLILVTCDGRGAGGTDGCRMSSDMVDIMRELGADDALKLDSGGSTTFYYDGAVRNVPSGGSERAVVDALVVTSVPLPCSAALAGGTMLIDDNGPCFSRTAQAWWSEPAGEQGSSIYTWATDEATLECSGRWSFSVDLPGTYRVEVHVPDVDGLSLQAAYRLVSGDGSQVAIETLDQQAARGSWAVLGTFTFGGGSNGGVELADNTGEPLGNPGRKVIYDAVRLVAEGDTIRLDAGEPADAGTAADSDVDGTPISGDRDAGSDAEPTPDAGTPEDAEGSCSCHSSSGSRTTGATLLALIVALALLKTGRRRGSER